jgi:hypothetical protein
MTHTGQIEVRHPVAGEVPAELIAGFEALPIDLEWQWVLIVDGGVEAQMLCAPMHGLLAILRLTAFPSTPAAWLVRFLRSVLADSHARGMIGYVTFLSDANPMELKLMRIVQRSGGMLLPSSGAWAFGSTEVRY